MELWEEEVKEEGCEHPRGTDRGAVRALKEQKPQKHVMSFLLFVVLFIHLVTYDASCQVLEFWSLPSLHYNGTRRQSAPGARKKIHLKKSTACLFPEIMTQMWRTLTLKSRPEHRAGRNELCGLLLGSRTVISGKSHCLLSFFFFFYLIFGWAVPSGIICD